MASQLTGLKRGYIGLSTDEKPISTTSQTIPQGSTFEEVDTGRIAVYDGRNWFVRKTTDERVVELLEELLQETKATREAFELFVANL
jgi:hypothetical protein